MLQPCNLDSNPEIDLCCLISRPECRPGCLLLCLLLPLSSPGRLPSPLWWQWPGLLLSPVITAWPIALHISTRSHLASFMIFRHQWQLVGHKVLYWLLDVSQLIKLTDWSYDPSANHQLVIKSHSNLSMASKVQPLRKVCGNDWYTSMPLDS